MYRSHFGSRYTFGPMRSSQAFLASIPCSPHLPFSLPLLRITSFVFAASLRGVILASGHTASNAPDLFRTPKLSGAGPGQYRGGGPPGKPLGCCWLFYSAASSWFNLPGAVGSVSKGKRAGKNSVETGIQDLGYTFLKRYRQ